jgi:hypothetical protein
MSEPLDPGVYQREECYRGAAWGMGYTKTARVMAMGVHFITPHPWYTRILFDEWHPYESVDAEWFREMYGKA